MKIRAFVRPICEKCRLIRRRGHLEMNRSYSYREKRAFTSS